MKRGLGLLAFIFLIIGVGLSYGADKTKSQKQKDEQQSTFKAKYVRIVSRDGDKEKVEGRGSMSNDWASGRMDMQPDEPLVLIFRDAVPSEYAALGLKINCAYYKKNKKWKFIKMIDSKLSIDEVAQLFGIGKELNKISSSASSTPATTQKKLPPCDVFLKDWGGRGGAKIEDSKAFAIVAPIGCVMEVRDGILVPCCEEDGKMVPQCEGGIRH